MHTLLGYLTGIPRGVTTFSTYSLDVASLYQPGASGMAAFYVLASAAVAVAALFLGPLIVRQFV